MEQKYYYFAYGSNLDCRRMFERCANSRIHSRASLAGYELTFQKNGSGRSVANILPATGEKVEGALYRVNLTDLLELDKFEGHPRVYHREWVEVKTNSGRVVKAITYVMSDPKNPKGTPSKDYFQYLHRGYTQWGIPKAGLLKALEGVSRVKEVKNKNKVFVYGTLLSGFGNHERYLSGVPHLEATLEGQYEMYHLGGFPALVKGDEAMLIVGEVYEVSDEELKALDGLEGYRADNPDRSFYLRELVTIEVEDGTQTEAFVYTMKQRPQYRGVTRLEYGDWREFMAGLSKPKSGQFPEDEDFEYETPDDIDGENICEGCGELKKHCICED